MQAKLPSLPFQLALGNDVAVRLHACLCSYGAKVPSFTQIPLKLRNAELRLPKCTPWEHLMAPSLPLKDMATRYVTRYFERLDSNAMRTTIANKGFWLRCPWYSAAKDTSSQTLYRNNCV